MYGGGALLIRELVRRAGRGVPTMLVLGLAYGLGEEGLVTRSLFNPDYAGAHLLDEGFVPALGIAVPWTLFVLTLHAVWSTTVPILLVEACTPARRRTPWLGRHGVAVAAALLVLGAAACTAVTQMMSPFLAPPVRLVAVAVLMIALAVLAFRLPHARHGAGTVPAPAVLGLIALAAGAVFMVGTTRLGAVGHVAVVLVLDVALVAAAVRWSTRPGWTDAHTLALVGGALLTYAWHAFPERPVVPVSPALDLAGNVAFAAAALALLALATTRTVRTPSPASGPPPEPSRPQQPTGR